MRNREDWLVEQLNNDNLSPTLRDKYEAELNRLAEAYTRAEENKKIAQAKEAARRAEIRAKVLANDEDFIQTMGEEEFGGDYELCEEQGSFVVYSKVARDDQEHRRVHASLEAAQKDLRYLYYNRMYDRYVRGGEVSVLGELVS